MDKPSKYKNKKPVIDDIEFDSIVESEYYLLLKKQKAYGIIIDFEIQPVYQIQEKFKSEQCGNIQAINYKADFEVTHSTGDRSVIDVKGMATPVSLLKRKMFLKKYGSKVNLLWVVKNKKHGNKYGWADYFELQATYRKIRKEKKKKEDLKQKQNNGI